jgi:hypothetical protein
MNRKNKYLQMLDENNLSNKDVVGIIERSMNLNARLACIYLDKDGELSEGCLKQFREFYSIYALISDEDKSRVGLLNDIQICHIKGLVNADKEQEQC